MATYKRIDGNYTLTTVNSSDNVVVNTHTMTVNGNLTVAGNLTYIDVTELNIQDPFIVLNASNTGSYEANSGILTHVTANAYAGFRYNDNTGDWELNTGDSDATGETGTWTPIVTGNVTIGGANTNVQFNDAGSFGGNANFTFDKTTAKLTLQGHLAYGNIGSTPSSVSNAAVLYNKAVGSGGTGLYVKSSTVDDELVSKSAAIVFSIIF